MIPHRRLYQRGAEKERRIVNKHKDEGWDISFRSAGSHSPIDVIAIHKEMKTIRCIQSKSKSFSKKKAKELEDTYAWLNDEFSVTFEVI